MRVHYLQHVPFENLGYLEPWLIEHGHSITKTLMYTDDSLPPHVDFDWLIVLGGPMSVNDETQYEWLVAEKALVKQAIDQNKYVLGICLGAQIIAASLGSRVYKNKHLEIGWFPVHGVQAPEDDSAVKLPAHFDAFHWHGETFDLPCGSTHLASSAGCYNQAFSYGNRVLALQFHLEATPDTASALIEHCGNEMTAAPYVQTPQEIMGDRDRFAAINNVLSPLLTGWLSGSNAIQQPVERIVTK